MYNVHENDPIAAGFHRTTLKMKMQIVNTYLGLDSSACSRSLISALASFSSLVITAKTRGHINHSKGLCLFSPSTVHRRCHRWSCFLVLSTTWEFKRQWKCIRWQTNYGSNVWSYRWWFLKCSGMPSNDWRAFIRPAAYIHGNACKNMHKSGAFAGHLSGYHSSYVGKHSGAVRSSWFLLCCWCALKWPNRAGSFDCSSPNQNYIKTKRWINILIIRSLQVFF